MARGGCARRASEARFQAAESCAIAGLTPGFLTWQVVFMSTGGAWFGMSMSKPWNGVPDAFRFFVTLLLVLVYGSMRNHERVADRAGPRC